jgi:DNA-binding winged helix-turn-helix (wHTH) protein/Flp pilus assembly protein TadD
MAGPFRERVLFGPFELDAGERLLLRDGQPVALPPRALDVLSVLAERPGQLVTKDELLAGAWPGVVVEENVLTVAISRLRSALGDEHRGYIQAVPGYGYRLVDVASALGDGLDAAAHPARPPQADELVATLAVHGDGASHVQDLSASLPDRKSRPARAGAWVWIGAAAGLFAVVGLATKPWDAAAPEADASASVAGDIPPEALAAYARGRDLWRSRGFDAMPEALSQFKRAATLAPDFAPAYSGQALVYALGYRTGDETEAAAARALALDSTLAEAWAARGFARAFHQWDWAGAGAAFDRALSLRPHDVTTLQWRASFLMAQRRLEEAEASLIEAARLAPEYASLHVDLCEVRYYRRDFAGARSACARALALDPGQPVVPNHLMFVDLAGPAGPEAARRWLRLNVGDFTASTRARMHARLGQRDSALAYVRIAVDDRVLVAPFMRPDPLFDAYRDDPRWIAAMRRMGLGP